MSKMMLVNRWENNMKKTGFSRFDDAGRVCPRKRGGARPLGFVSPQFDTMTVAYPRNDRSNYGRLWLLAMIPGVILIAKLCSLGEINWDVGMFDR